MDRVALDLGFFQIYWYSIFIFLAMVTACFLIIKEARRKQINQEFLGNVIFYSIIIGIIGARSYYVLFNLSYYLENPIEIFEIWNGGLAIHGGILASTSFIFYYCRKYKVEIIKILDITVVGLIIAQAIGRWGNFFNGEAYGQITTYQNLIEEGIPEFVIKGMYISGEYRQPTFFYESCWCLIGFIIMLLIRKLYQNLKNGQLAGFYLIWYGIGRFLIEGLRTDSLMIGPFKIAQIVSILFIIVGLYLFNRYNRKKYNSERYLYNHIAPKKEQQ